MGFPGDSVVKNLPVNTGDTEDMGLIPGSGRSPEEGKAIGSSLLAWKIPLGRGAWQATVSGVTESGTTEWAWAETGFTEDLRLAELQTF